MRSHEYDVPLGLITVARHHIGAPQLHESFLFARRHMPVFQAQLEELDQILGRINTEPLEKFPMDLVNTRELKGYLRTRGIGLPLVLFKETHKDPYFRNLYLSMLTEGNSLLGPFFHFHTAVQDVEDRLGCAVLDGYGLFVPFLLGRTDASLKKTQGLAVNALSEILAESQAQNSGRPLRLFTIAKDNGWYKPDYGLGKDFLLRHKLWKEPGKLG